MKIRIVIIAASIGMLALAQTNLAQAAYAGSDPDQQSAKLTVTASVPPIDGNFAVARLASDVLVKPRGAVRMAGCITYIGQGIYEICTGIWPAPGSADTELGVFMEPEVSHGEAEVYTRVQA